MVLGQVPQKQCLKQGFGSTWSNESVFLEKSVRKGKGVSKDVLSGKV